ncbi:tyrosine-type recombinase/integrase [Streptomyces sp. NPDC050564]|uniref:tyrosine-type recombinase/integrase n=1 Tax=Streptomyces sp. NPDC050564 TaxID=3365631 RepID=UPI003796373A
MSSITRSSPVAWAAFLDHGHVCVEPQGGQLRRSNFRDDRVTARKAAGGTSELHFHNLRHTGKTLASTAGAGARELMPRIGHSSARAALIHQHMTSDRDQTIADRLGAMIRDGGGLGSWHVASTWHEWDACGTASNKTKGRLGRRPLLRRPFSLCPWKRSPSDLAAACSFAQVR